MAKLTKDEQIDAIRKLLDVWPTATNGTIERYLKDVYSVGYDGTYVAQARAMTGIPREEMREPSKKLKDVCELVFIRMLTTRYADRSKAINPGQVISRIREAVASITGKHVKTANLRDWVRAWLKEYMSADDTFHTALMRTRAKELAASGVMEELEEKQVKPKQLV